MTETDTALAPCPFCGKPPKSGDSSYGYWLVFCSDENDCLPQPSVELDSEAEAIAAWNTRTQQPRPDASVECLSCDLVSVCEEHDGDPIVFDSHTILAALRHPAPHADDALRAFQIGDRVTKIKGSKWTGRVVGFYSTSLTPEGYNVESENEPGSVQVYPRAALASEEPKP